MHHWERLRYLFKSIGVWIYIPVIVLCLILPMFTYLSYSHNGLNDDLYRDILQLAQILIPFFSVWWNVFILREFVEADGYELLSVTAEKYLPLDNLIVFVLCMLNVLILFVAYTLMFTSMRFEYLRLLCICAFYFGTGYLLMKLTRSVTLTILFCLLLSMANFSLQTFDLPFPFYYNVQPVDSFKSLQSYLPYLGVGIILYVIASRTRAILN